MCEQTEFDLGDEYDGYDKHRLDPEQNNPCEMSLHDAWKELNAGYHGDLLERLFHNMVITHRDKRIASTVIQWLGTNCGRGFLYKARGKMKESTKKFLRLLSHETI